MTSPRARQGRSRSKRSVSSSFETDREKLRTLLLRQGLQHAAPGLALVGAATPWRLDALSVTLTHEGAELAGRCLLHLLGHFEGRQLAASTPAGVALLQACVLGSGGRYRGLLIRKEAEADGPGRLVEGRIEPGEPVVLIDEFIRSGTSMEECAARLEGAGLYVEGGVCLVRSGYEGGFSRLLARGLPVRSLFDFGEDLLSRVRDGQPFASNPTRFLPPHERSSDKAPEGLHPTDYARRVITEALRTGRLLRAPQRMGGRFSGAGGVWVSLRAKEGAASRPVRGGFWLFPGEKPSPLPVAVGHAAFLAARELARVEPEPLAALERSTVAVTFCSALEECAIGQLDNDQYGVVVRSRERPSLVGGALPRMPGLANEWQQFEHARAHEARLAPGEPWLLYRHKLQRAVEPGSPWPPDVASTGGASSTGPALPASPPPKTLAEGVARLTPPLCKFLLRHLGETARYEPFTDTAQPGLSPAELAHQAWTLARAHKALGPAPIGEGARTLLTALTSDLITDDSDRVWIRSDEGPSIAELSLTLLALLETGEDHATAGALAATLWACIGPHGRFTCRLEPGVDDEALQDSLPGLALLALARAAEEKVRGVDAEKLSRARRFYRHRFRHQRHWGQVCWLTQAEAAWWRVDRNAEPARLAFEICDWALGHQSEKTGAFLTDQQPDTPGYTTALELQALAAAAQLAVGLKDRTREKRYLAAAAKAVAFLDGLVFQDRDAPRLPNPRRAVGGVRASLTRHAVHTDFVHHTLSALLSLRR